MILLFSISFIFSFLYAKPLIKNENIINSDYTSVYLPVISSEKYYITEKVKQPVERCYETIIKEKHYIEDNNINEQKPKDENSIGIDTVIGGVLGVVIGNQIGHGNGRDAAKIVGGIAGATIANKSRNYQDPEKHHMKEVYEEKPIKKCNIEYEYKENKILYGYKNYFILNGVKKVKISKEKLNQVQININYNW